MTDTPRSETGTIYDIGYRHYDGELRGRGYAVASLVEHDIRRVFAIGRGFRAMIIPLVLAAMAVLPALIQTLLRAYIEIVPEFLSYANYFERLSVVFALFCAARAPSLVCGDQRSHTLVLYFARALHRSDYALAKVLALGSSIFALAVTPLLVIFAGQVLASAEPFAAFFDELSDLLPIVGSSLVLALMMASVSLAIAALTRRSRMAAAAVLAYFLLSAAVTEILVEIVDASWDDLLEFLNPFSALEGFAEWAFGSPVGAFGNPAGAPFPGWVYLAVCLAYVGLALALLLARYRRIGT